MKKYLVFACILTLSILYSCRQKDKADNHLNIIYLHHSTGEVIWNGSAEPGSLSDLPAMFDEYNRTRDKMYIIKEQEFPKASPYGWNNYPYDYYNIWVKNAGKKPFRREPTLEILTSENDVIIFKHCFPVSAIQPDDGTGDINSNQKNLANYKLQYAALKAKINQFPETKFILFTGAALVQGQTREDEALRASEFFSWVKEDWDTPNDNIFIWDLYKLQTEEGIFLKNEYAVSLNDSHPNEQFATRVARLLFNRIIDVIENNGTKTTVTGESI